MNRWTIPVAKVTVAVGMTLGSLALTSHHAVTPAALVDDRAPEYVCYEDQPCWDCAAMGNRRCGPEVVRPDGALMTPDEVPAGVAVGFGPMGGAL